MLKNRSFGVGLLGVALAMGNLALSLPAAAQSGMTPEQMPASPPEVTFRNGQLTVSSKNSTLGAVLAMIRTRTGAAIEGPLEAATERVAVDLGPAPVEEVLAGLLHGSRFDYVVLGSAANPGGVDRIILTARQASGASSAPAPSAVRQTPEEPQLEEEPQSEPDNMPPGMNPNAGVQQSPSNPQSGIPVRDAETGERPNLAQPPQDQGQGQVQGQGRDQQAPKTPEQLLRELQQMQQMQQQNGRSQQ
ncbi:MAG TPA: hypothetical protein VG892_10255 [Terriglobales bacterium]|nr:hypothetical protein [Terriglobales bacterium]